MTGLGLAWTKTDAGLCLVLGALAVLLFPLGFILDHPFFVDEAWVAVGARAPVPDIPYVAFPTPTAWAVLLRLPWPGEQGMRLLPLAFGVGAVIAAYSLGRDLGWKSVTEARVVGLMVATGVMLSPWALMRQDLKQYTADACLALLILWLASRAESRVGLRPILILAVASVVSSVLSWTSMFVSAAVLGGLFLSAMFRKDKSRLGMLTIAGFAVATAFGLVYLTLIAPNLWAPLSPYWEDYYLGGTVRDVVQEMGWRYLQVTTVYPWPIPVIGIGAFVLGVITFVRKRRALGWAVLLLLVIMVTIGLFGRYPFLDQRTSHFLLIIGVAVAAVGLASLVVRVLDRSTPWGVLSGLAVGVVLVVIAFPHIRNPAILLEEDVRSQVRYVQEHRSADEVVVVNHTGHFGLAYYWVGGELEFVRPGDTQFQVRVVGDGPILMTLGDPYPVLQEALDLAAAQGTDHVWIVRSHVIDWEPAAWEAAFARAGVEPRVIDVGIEPLLVIELSPV